ncbi:hypothetical protein RMSM_02039 [Rhodopirellula maiorica SM1]|uniref:Uncharacterized protein n=1 Tax=Rhodopirellula maiorica SM1 TaxID=1265738 RepID=M5S4B9_9BACT|nr:hypothetical protein [Rhodopirellula maiorica]EMI21039.1 hypothetical protein RMSM_02039 [Rhodopirellula maiorica SM1]
MNFQLKQHTNARNRFRLTIFAIGFMGTVVGCGGGGDAGIIAGEGEISRYIQEHPELTDASSEEEKAPTPEAPAGKQTARRSDA